MPKPPVHTITFISENGLLQGIPFILEVPVGAEQVRFINKTDTVVTVTFPDSNFFRNETTARKFIVSPNSTEGVTKHLVGGLSNGVQTIYSYTSGDDPVGVGDSPSIIIRNSAV
jgi:hypothetical protein